MKNHKMISERFLYFLRISHFLYLGWILDQAEERTYQSAKIIDRERIVVKAIYHILLRKPSPSDEKVLIASTGNRDLAFEYRKDLYKQYRKLPWCKRIVHNNYGQNIIIHRVAIISNKADLQQSLKENFRSTTFPKYDNFENRIF